MKRLDRATMVGEKWSVELRFDEKALLPVARAAREGKTNTEYSFLPFNVVSRTGCPGAPRIAWFSDSDEALEYYQNEIARFSRRKE